MTKIADDAQSIATRLKEIQEEKLQAIMGVPLEDPQPVEAPKDIDWTAVDSVYGMYGSPSGLNDAAREYMASKAYANYFQALQRAKLSFESAPSVLDAYVVHLGRGKPARYHTEQEIADWRKDYGL